MENSISTIDQKPDDLRPQWVNPGSSLLRPFSGSFFNTKGLKFWSSFSTSMFILISHLPTVTQRSARNICFETVGSSFSVSVSKQETRNTTFHQLFRKQRNRKQKIWHVFRKQGNRKQKFCHVFRKHGNKKHFFRILVSKQRNKKQ